MIPKDQSGGAAGGGIGLDPISLIGGGLLGGIKGLFDMAAARRKGRINAAVTAYSPWTHVQPQEDVERANPYGDVLQGAAQGLSFGQNLEANTLGRARQKRMDDLYTGVMQKKYGIDPNNFGGE